MGAKQVVFAVWNDLQNRVVDWPSGGIGSFFSLFFSALYAFHAAPLQAFASYRHRLDRWVGYWSQRRMSVR